MSIKSAETRLAKKRFLILYIYGLKHSRECVIGVYIHDIHDLHPLKCLKHSLFVCSPCSVFNFEFLVSDLYICKELEINTEQGEHTNKECFKHSVSYKLSALHCKDISCTV